MAINIAPIGEEFESFLNHYAIASPNRLTNPEFIRFFVLHNERYYPIYDINYEVFPDKTGIETIFGKIVINRYVYCLNPSSAASPFTGLQFLREREKADHVFKWTCSEFDGDYHRLHFDFTYAEKGAFVIVWVS